MEDKRISTRSPGISTPMEPCDNPETLLRGKTADKNVPPAHQHDAHTSQDSAGFWTSPYLIIEAGKYNLRVFFNGG